MTQYYLISFDCESTGLSCERDQIVEFGAAVWLYDGTEFSEIGTFCQYAKPTIATMSKGAYLVTGINMDKLRDMPPIHIVLGQFTKFIDNTCVDDTIPRILLSYNGFRYDIPILVNELERCPSTSAITYFRRLKIELAIDVLPFCRQYIEKTDMKRRADGGCSFKLGDVYASMCKRELSGAHGALADSRAVLDVVTTNKLVAIFLTTISHTSDDICCKPMELVQQYVNRSKRKTKATNTVKNMLSKRQCL